MDAEYMEKTGKGLVEALQPFFAMLESDQNLIRNDFFSVF